MAAASIHVMRLSRADYERQTEPMRSYINVGYGQDTRSRNCPIRLQTWSVIKALFVFDASKLDGAPRKLMDSRRIRELGWRPQFGLRQGLKLTYQDFLKTSDEISAA